MSSRHLEFMHMGSEMMLTCIFKLILSWTVSVGLLILDEFSITDSRKKKAEKATNEKNEKKSILGNASVVDS